MNIRTSYFVFLVSLFLVSCEGGGDPFASYHREYLGKTQVGASITKEIGFQNSDINDVQHITGLNFETGSNSVGNFRIDKVEVGGVAVNPRNKDISVPAGSLLQVYVTYQPLNLNTTVADFGGWSTGQMERYEPQKPAEDNASTDAIKAMTTIVVAELALPCSGRACSADSGKASFATTKADDITTSPKPAIHRSIMTIVYDYPKSGSVQVELVGEAEPGPNGETSAAGGSSGECPDTVGIACYTGAFAIDLPDIVSTGPKPLKLTGPIVFGLSGSNITLDMSKFPAALLVLKGNGPGEPLEGKPINAISIVISGTEGVSATGTFDGSRLEVNGVAFRIRVVLGEITEADLTPGLQAAVDFSVKDLKIMTTKPYTSGSITLSVDGKLSEKPSGNALFDQFLGNTRVVITMDGSFSY